MGEDLPCGRRDCLGWSLGLQPRKSAEFDALVVHKVRKVIFPLFIVKGKITMNKCKNCLCENPTNRKYCSFRCRNIYVNKNIRDYSILTHLNENRKKLLTKNYLENPKYCKHCNSVIDYDKRDNIFCSSSCSASFNNTGKKKSKEIRKKISKALSGRKLKYEVWNKGKEKIEKKVCLCCGKLHNNKKFCNRKCRIENERKRNSEFKNYRLDCQFHFSLSDYPNEFDFKLLKKYGIYRASNRGNNLNGISRDHMFSIYDGFYNNINSEIIKHPANCRLVRQNENSSKWKKSSITIDKLKQRIDEWNTKYKYKRG